MKTMMIPAGLCFLLSGLGAAHADVAVGVSASFVVEPTVPVPTLVPPGPPVQLPPAPVHVHYAAPAPSVVVTAPAATRGQWVYTAQYGWLYMPYGSRYFLTRAAGPYAYVYYPSYGWRWLAAPWIVGSGPYPHFGAHGPFHYAWYRGLHRAGHPMTTHYAHVHHRPWIAPRTAAPFRPGYPARAIASHGPARAGIAHRPVMRPHPTLLSQRAHVAPRHAGFGPRGRR